MSGPWDGETGTTDGDACSVSWSDAGMGMYVAVLQGVIYDAVVASPNVDSVATDDDGQIAGGPMPGSNAPVKTFIQAQAKAPWNVARISSRKAVGTNPTYYYNSTAGQGVDIYLLDTGVLTTHTQFSQRAKIGANIGLGTTDGNGHGTFCASVAIGATYGVAKKANIYSIKVMTDSGGGTASNVVKGVAATLKMVAKSKRPSIISLSASFPANSALDAAAKKAFTKGIHFVSAAGNAGADASSYSPARSPYSVTVGAIDASDMIAKFSNTGQVVSLFAGGVNVLGAYIGNTGASATLSGTSMATPAVAGLIAYYISVWGNAAPAVMQNALTIGASNGTVKGLPAGTANLIAGNCYNRTCFDPAQPAKYVLPPPPPVNVTVNATAPVNSTSAVPTSTANVVTVTVAPNAAYVRVDSPDPAVPTGAPRTENPSVAVAKGTAFASRASGHVGDSLSGAETNPTSTGSSLPTDGSVFPTDIASAPPDLSSLATALSSFATDLASLPTASTNIARRSFWRSLFT
ncbi:hypothetical protein JCM1841_006054 [Sporobolomyces salmonicolor]